VSSSQIRLLPTNNFGGPWISPPARQVDASRADLRAARGRVEIPVIAVTAHAMVTEQDRILRAGCRACLSKPIEFRVLRNELERWLVPAKTPQIDS